jgi:hypothetical protein
MSEPSGHDCEDYLSLRCLDLPDGGPLASLVAFPGASHLGIKKLSFQSAGKDMNVYENCSISVNAANAPVDTEDEGRFSNSHFPLI